MCKNVALEAGPLAGLQKLVSKKRCVALQGVEAPPHPCAAFQNEL